MMDCPACSKTLQQITCGDIELDVCKNGCGGIWFDRDELLKFDEPHEFMMDELLELAKNKESVKVEQKQKFCPKCPGEPLVKQFLDIKNQVQMDQCWNCSGIWLDVGEINTVRSQYKNMEERAKAVNEYINGNLEQTIGAMQQDTKEQVRKYNEETSNRLKGGLFALKRLLGLDNDPLDGL